MNDKMNGVGMECGRWEEGIWDMKVKEWGVECGKTMRREWNVDEKFTSYII